MPELPKRPRSVLDVNVVAQYDYRGGKAKHRSGEPWPRQDVTRSLVHGASTDLDRGVS